MKRSYRVTIIAILVIVLLSSCNLPFIGGNDVDENIPPNLTLTALFDTSMNIPPTVTPGMPTAEAVNPPTMTAASIPTLWPSFTPTTNPIPTNTSVPPTPEIRQRGGTLMKAGYLSTAPVIDGTYAEWVDKTNKYAIPHLVWLPANWKNMADLEGAFAAGWDDKYLYISVKVTDDIFVQNLSGEMLYLGDSVEVLIDANLDGDFFVTSLNNDDFQFGISPGNPDKDIDDEVYLWYPVSLKGSKSQVLVASLFETSPIYRVEVGIPWSLLGVSPYDGLHLGFAVSVNDNDSPGKNIQETMISTAQYRNFLNPTTWGEIVLFK